MQSGVFVRWQAATLRSLSDCVSTRPKNVLWSSVLLCSGKSAGAAPRRARPARRGSRLPSDRPRGPVARTALYPRQPGKRDPPPRARAPPPPASSVQDPCGPCGPRVCAPRRRAGRRLGPSPRAARPECRARISARSSGRIAHERNAIRRGGEVGGVGAGWGRDADGDLAVRGDADGSLPWGAHEDLWTEGKERKQRAKGGMGGRHAATTQGF